MALAGAAGAPPDEGRRLTRDTATMSLMTLLSRVTGFARIAVVSGVLGTTLLGNTYQTTNTVPNLVFELFAAGMLQAVLVPELVGVLGARGRPEGERIAGLVLGALLAVLGALALAGAVAAPLISRALFAGSPAEGALYDRQVWLGTVFLWIFLPQLLFYAIGMVGTAVLNAHDRFGVPAFAPVLNNVVVIGAYIAFGVLHGDSGTLQLSVLEVAVLAGGTTLAVAAFTAAPALAVLRSGFSLRPRWGLTDPTVRRLGRQGLWAGVFLALIQVLLLAAIVLGNAVEGGVVVYQFAWTFFLLPHALISIPVFTALFPSLSRAAQRGDDPWYRSLLGRGCSAVWVLALPAAAAMVALGGPAARVALFGRAASSADEVAATMAAFAVGLAPYGLFLLLMRAAYAQGEARLPALVHVATTVIGIAGMVTAALVLDGDARIAGLAGAHSVAYLAGSVLLRRRMIPWAGRQRLVGLRVGGGALAAAVVSGLAMAGMAAVVDGLVAGDGRTSALVELAVAAPVGVAVYLAFSRLAGVPDPWRLLHPSSGGVTGSNGGAGADGASGPDRGAGTDGAPGPDRGAGAGGGAAVAPGHRAGGGGAGDRGAGRAGDGRDGPPARGGGDGG
ncbi:MAG: murein biosynthesis integral membrane protein MurJ [Acidimicrobiia bacterium]